MPSSAALPCARLPRTFYSGELKVLLTTGQKPEKDAAGSRLAACHAFIAFTPCHTLPSEQLAARLKAAQAYTSPEQAGLTLLLNPRTKQLEAHDHHTGTVSTYPVDKLDPQVAFDVLAMCKTPAAQQAYNAGYWQAKAFIHHGRPISPQR